jgi:hypothetical protein
MKKLFLVCSVFVYVDGWMGKQAHLLEPELLKFYSYSVPKTSSVLGLGLMNLNIPPHPQRRGLLVVPQNKMVIFLNRATMILIDAQ